MKTQNHPNLLRFRSLSALAAFVVVAICLLWTVTTELSGQTSSTVVIVDNSDPGFSASSNWGTARARDQYGADYRFRKTATISDPASWTVNLPAAGVWRVDAWWPTVSGTTSVPYIIHHSGGSSIVNRDQTVNGGQWNTLGTFTFNSGNQQVQISAWGSNGSIVLADAIRWVKQ